MSEELRRKLSSRKLWAAVAAVIVTVLTVVFKGQLDPELVKCIGDAVTALCVYIGGETAVDVARQIFASIEAKNEKQTEAKTEKAAEPVAEVAPAKAKKAK